MRYVSYLLSLLLLATTARAQAPAWTGAAQGVNPTPTNDTVADGTTVAADATGNSYIGGSLLAASNGTVPCARLFGTTRLTSTGLASGFIAKLSPARQWLWAVRAASTGPNGTRIDRVTLAPNGDVYALGTVREAAATTLQVGTLSQPVSTGSGTFIARLNSSGAVQTLTVVALPPSSTYLYVRGMQWDPVTNALVVAGYFAGRNITLGSTLLATGNYGDSGLYVARLTAAGQWQNVVQATLGINMYYGYVSVGSAVVGLQGQVVMSVTVLDANITLGSFRLAAVGSSSAASGIFQLSAAGQWQWMAQQTPANNVNSALSPVGIDRLGNTWLAFQNAAGLQLGSFTPPTGTIYGLARLSPTGQWGAVACVTATPGSYGYFPRAFAVDAGGNIIATGYAQDGTYLHGSLSFSVTNNFLRNYVSRVSPAGQWQYITLGPATSVMGNNGGRPNAAAFDDNGTLHIAGSLDGNVTYASSVLVGSTGAGYDPFVAQLGGAGALGVRQAADAPQLALYPNPAAGTEATLELPAPAPAALPFVVRDALGRTVCGGMVPSGQRQAAVPTAGLAPGLYLLEAGPSRVQLVIE